MTALILILKYPTASEGLSLDLGLDMSYTRPILMRPTQKISSRAYETILRHTTSYLRSICIRVSLSATMGCEFFCAHF